MAEMDAFERRLRTALVRHVDSGPTDFDALAFARAVAAKEPRRHGPANALTWRGLAFPRLVWALLLLGLLVVAMVGGALIAGSQPVRKLAAMAPAFVCPPGSTPDEPGPVDQARPPSGMFAPFAFDRRAGKLVAAVSPTVGPGPVETWVFDVCTNTWARMHPDREPPAQLRTLVYDADSGLTIGVHSEDWVDPPVRAEDVWAYEPLDETASLEFWSFDVEADTWTLVRQATRPEHLGASAFVFDTSVDRMVEMAWGMALGVAWGDYRTPETRLFDVGTGAWSRSGVQMPDFRMKRWAVPTVVYDESAQRTLVASDDQWGTYDAIADRWEILFDGGAEMSLARSMTYDPTNRRLIVMGGWMGDGIGANGDIVAFDLVTRKWTVLLESR
jgi:hypothetical protein